jgi:hypothetical protein
VRDVTPPPAPVVPKITEPLKSSPAKLFIFKINIFQIVKPFFMQGIAEECPAIVPLWSAQLSCVCFNAVQAVQYPAVTWSKLMGKEVTYAGHGDFDSFEAQLWKTGSPSWLTYDLRVMFQGYVERGFSNTAKHRSDS